MTNLANLITVTNLVGTAPTVTIVRPANGMLYPAAFTNQKKNPILQTASGSPRPNQLSSSLAKTAVVFTETPKMLKV